MLHASTPANKLFMMLLGREAEAGLETELDPDSRIEQLPLDPRHRLTHIHGL